MGYTVLEDILRFMSTDYSNQDVPISSDLTKELQRIFAELDSHHVAFAFGYGSGVFEQKGYDTKGTRKPQIDLILGVKNPLQFHEYNLDRNGHHYSALKYIAGPHTLARVQNWGAGVYFNPYTRIQGREVKYGVVAMDVLLRDLRSWNTFYLAGRLQKPVKILKNNIDVLRCNQMNLKAAATVAVRTLSKHNQLDPFNEFAFYRDITGLSYLGDFRYKVGGENPKKVDNIVEKNLSRFQSYYKPIVHEVVYNGGQYLPQGYTAVNAKAKLKTKVAKTSLIQTLKGIATAGIVKSVKYAWAKKMKALLK